MPQQDILQQNIINLLGLQALPEERKLALLDKMTTLILKRVTLRLLEILKDEEQDELAKIFEQGDSEELAAFLVKTVPNFEELVKEEITKFKQEAAQKLKSLKA